MIVVSACLVGKNCRYNAQTKALLKARSPSCAIKTFGESKSDGLFTQILRDRFENIELFDEEMVGKVI